MAAGGHIYRRTGTIFGGRVGGGNTTRSLVEHLRQVSKRDAITVKIKDGCRWAHMELFWANTTEPIVAHLRQVLKKSDQWSRRRCDNEKKFTDGRMDAGWFTIRLGQLRNDRAHDSQVTRSQARKPEKLGHWITGFIFVRCQSRLGWLLELSISELVMHHYGSEST